jgi:hypothetical protein
MCGSESERAAMGSKTCCCRYLGNGLYGRKRIRVWEMFDDVWAGGLEWDFDFD